VALRIGLVSDVAEDAGTACESIVQDILQGGPIAVREAKRLVRERPQGLDTAHIAAARRTSDEGQEGLRAFLERRSAGWLD
jgi:methylglutaconyl-CoA hydratase